MYSPSSTFEESLRSFGHRVDVIIAMEMADKLSAEEAYQYIKTELKTLKQVRKLNKDEEE
tara:strand:+ start:45 stop:224 length:180 start_codon:yes stop_codon:yes gene_type:complete